MKREELQIGDIVNVHRCECVADGGHFQEWDEYGKVVSITEYYITIKYIGREEDYGFEDVNEEDIKPIPLTTQILEKNGFRKESYIEVVGGLDTYYLGEEIGSFRIHRLQKGYYQFGLAKINFVHQLQHALRLCGINKEIEI